MDNLNPSAVEKDKNDKEICEERRHVKADDTKKKIGDNASHVNDSSDKNCEEVEWGSKQVNGNSSKDAVEGGPRKLFVGGLGWNTHQGQLHEYFSQFGPITSAEVMYNRDTGVPRGFGFVTFADTESAQAAESQKHHCINQKTAEIKFAVKRGDERLVSEAFIDKLARQIFVGGLPRDATPDELKNWAQGLFGKEKVASAILVSVLLKHPFYPPF